MDDNYLVNGCGLFFFNSKLKKNDKLNILNWYNGLSKEHKNYVDILRNEAIDDSEFYSD
jgi:hypothetical protein